MKHLRVGILGYGIVGERRHSVMKEMEDISVVAVCDVKFMHKTDPILNAQVFSDTEEFLETPMDAVFVCLPNDLAPEATIKCLKKGCHVFCEKPPGRTVEDINKVIEVEKQNPHLKLKYGFNHRYHDSVVEALNLIKRGDFGKTVNIRAVYGKSAFKPWPRRQAKSVDPNQDKIWRTDYKISGGGILLDQGIHMVDLILCFAGEIEEVKSYVSNSYWQHDVEDNAYALMRTKNNAVVFLHSTATQWRHRFSLEIFLEQGALILTGILSGTKSYGQETLTILFREEDDNGNPREQKTSYIRDHSWKREIEEFKDAILNANSILVGSSTEALRSMELVHQIYRADPTWDEHLKRLQSET